MPDSQKHLFSSFVYFFVIVELIIPIDVYDDLFIVFNSPMIIFFQMSWEKPKTRGPRVVTRGPRGTHAGPTRGPYMTHNWYTRDPHGIHVGHMRGACDGHDISSRGPRMTNAGPTRNSDLTPGITI